MNPNADQIAEAIVLAATLNVVDPVDVLISDTQQGRAGGVSRARRVVSLALAGTWGKPLYHWPAKLGWSKNSKSASVYMNQARARKVHEFPEFEMVVRELGRDLDDVLAVLVPQEGNKKTEGEAIAELLSEIPTSRTELKTYEQRLAPSKPDSRLPRSQSVKVTRSADRARLERMKKHMLERPSPKAPTPARNSPATATDPLETAFMGPMDMRIIEKVQRLQRAGDGLNSIRNTINAEFQVHKSMDWVTRATITELPRDAA